MLTARATLRRDLVRVLYNHVLVKKKIFRFTNIPFMTKTLRKSIMHRSKSKNIYNKSGRMIIGQIIKNEMNFCVNPLGKTKKDFFQKLDIRDLKENSGKQSSSILLTND